ncbi:MAG: acyl-CoA dehydrogenase family protein [Chloroflexi bacterium]|nr:acyl-CoA dehydrogenase family protein [Chloroflexota bacterium]
MDFRFTPEQEAFRQEIRQFLVKELPPDWTKGGHNTEEEEDEGEHKDNIARQLAKKMGAKGWLTGAWPKKYGGLGWTPMEQVIFAEEMTKHKVPRPYIQDAGTNNVGPTIAVHGTEEQKTKWLPGIARADSRWCQLMSEPNAGSDLAGLETKAVEDGDDFVVNGTKIWTSNAHKSDFGALMARTDMNAPKHKGISFMIVDMHTPGITFQPLVNINDVHSFNQVFLDNVRVPKTNLIGEKNKGWYSGATVLNMERSFIRHSIISGEYYDEVVAFLKKGINGRYPLKENEVLRHKLAELQVELRVSRLLAYRVAWLQSQNKSLAYESSMSKLYTGEMAQRLSQVVMEAFGLYGQIKEHSPHEHLRGKMQQIYLTQRGITIGGGTSEIQRNLMARRGLGLGQAA